MTPYSLEQRLKLIAEARNIFWTTKSIDDATQNLLPALAEKQVWTYPLLVGLYQSLGDVDKAAVFAKEFVSRAFEAGDLMEVVLAIENNLFVDLPLDENLLYQRALLALAKEDDWVAQTKLALCYKKGKFGFERDEGLCFDWMGKAAESGRLDPVCYYVELLVKRNLKVEEKFLALLRNELKKKPHLRDVEELLGRALKSGFAG